MNTRVCKHCGQSEDDHCHFEPKTVPSGCVCDPGTWGDNIPLACAKFVGKAGEYCATCEHDEACHTPPRAGERRNDGEA